MRVSNTSERLRTYLKEHDLTQTELYNMIAPVAAANAVKLSKSGLNQYVHGLFEPSQDKIYVIAQAIGVSPLWLMGYDEDDSNREKAKNIVLIHMKQAFSEGMQSGHPDAEFPHVDVSIECDSAMRVVGDSMQPTFFDGDFVLIHRQDDVEDGQIAVIVSEGTAILKRLYHISNGIQLISDNPRYKPVTITESEMDSVRIYGLVVAFQRRIN